MSIEEFNICEINYLNEENYEKNIELKKSIRENFEDEFGDFEEATTSSEHFESEIVLNAQSKESQLFSRFKSTDNEVFA